MVFVCRMKEKKDREREGKERKEKEGEGRRKKCCGMWACVVVCVGLEIEKAIPFWGGGSLEKKKKKKNNPLNVKVVVFNLNNT